MVSRAGRVAALVLVAAALASAAEVNRLVKARVTVAGDVRWFQHEVVVSNQGEDRRVSSVLLWHNIWLPLEPKELTAPEGWSVRALHRDGPGGVGWAVQFDCVERRPAVPPPSDAAESTCGIAKGETVKFRVTLPYSAGSLQAQPVVLVFSDGRLGLAS